MGKIEKMQQIRELLTGANRPRPIYYKNRGEPNPPDFRPGTDIIFENWSAHFSVDRFGNFKEKN